jgi:hypothetical protein
MFAAPDLSVGITGCREQSRPEFFGLGLSDSK